MVMLHNTNVLSMYIYDVPSHGITITLSLQKIPWRYSKKNSLLYIMIQNNQIIQCSGSLNSNRWINYSNIPVNQSLIDGWQCQTHDLHQLLTSFLNQYYDSLEYFQVSLYLEHSWIHLNSNPFNKIWFSQSHDKQGKNISGLWHFMLYASKLYTCSRCPSRSGDK